MDAVLRKVAVGIRQRGGDVRDQDLPRVRGGKGADLLADAVGALLIDLAHVARLGIIQGLQHDRRVRVQGADVADDRFEVRRKVLCDLIKP